MFIVIEIQEDEYGEVTTNMTEHDSQYAAESAYHLIVSNAAVSTAVVHTGVLISEEGFLMERACYKHTPEEPEPDEPIEPEEPEEPEEPTEPTGGDDGDGGDDDGGDDDGGDDDGGDDSGDDEGGTGGNDDSGDETGDEEP